MLRTLFNEKVSVSKPRKGAFRARKMLQRFGYSLLKQLQALLFRSYASSSVERKLLWLQGQKFGNCALLRILRQNFEKFRKKLFVKIILRKPNFRSKNFEAVS